MRKELYLVGYASGAAGVDSQTGNGPFILKSSVHLSAFTKKGMAYRWEDIIQPALVMPTIRHDELIRIDCERLAQIVSCLAKKHHFFAVIGGDHASAIGTWSGVYDALSPQGDLGLIWVDAHMDSHTPETSLSGRIHGMPLACLLGYGYPTLTNILHENPKLKPEHVCLVGVRSYESGEAELLKRLGVRIFFMDEIKKRGLQSVMNEAHEIVNRDTIAYGLSIDLDGFDPEDAPGVEVPEKNGIRAQEFLQTLTRFHQDPRLVGIEIVEFDAALDKEEKTEKLLVHLLERFAS
jgi:arginase